MTGLLQEALRRIESLSQAEQDAIASRIIETLDDEEARALRFRNHPERLRSMAREALEEHRRGETRPLDELIIISSERPGTMDLSHFDFDDLLA
jgi:mRNA degradation ribonuclease J1/J2